MRRLIFFFLFVACTAVAQQAPASPLTAKQVQQRVDDYVRELASAGELSGTLVVMRGDEKLYEKSWGMADYELDVPVTPGTKICVASISKPLTIILAYNLMAAGKLSLEDKLAKYIPDFPKGDKITVGDIMSHRAGIHHRVIPEAEQTKPYTPEDMARLAAKAGFTFEPGTQSSYSSGGYALLARVLEIAGGKPFNQLMDEHVHHPAGARNTVASADRITLLKGRAYSYAPFTPRRHTAFRDLSFLVGAGATYSTPSDLAKIGRHLIAGKYVGDPRQRLLAANGFRWNGITNGYRAFMDYHHAKDVMVIYATNLFTGSADMLRRDVPRIVAGESVAAAKVPKPTPQPMDASQRAEIGGRYSLGPGSEIVLEFTPDGSQAWYGDWILIPTGRDVFFSPATYQPVRIERSPEGKVIAIAWTEGPRFEKIH